MNKLNGRAKKEHITEKDVDPNELKIGIEVEFEHTKDRATAKKFALDHLAEFKNYYTNLLKMEKKLKKQTAKESTNIFNKLYDQILIESDHVVNQDAEYMAAVERGDTATAQRMVDEAARKAGYNVGPVLRGTNAKKEKSGRPALWFTTDMDYAKAYSATGPYTGSYLRHEPKLMPTDATSRVDRFYLRNPKRGLELKPWGMQGEAEVFSVQSQSDAKSADAITRDNQGNVIPLSQRFNAASSDIRY